MKKARIAAAAMLAAIFVMALAVSASAMEVPTETHVRNLDGLQQYIKVYTVAPETDPAELIEEPFEFNGYTYVYAEIVKTENVFAETKAHTETVTVETEKKDLGVVLDALAPSIEYDDGVYRGVLNLDHTTIQTEAAGSAWNGNVAVCGHNRGTKYVIGSIKDLQIGDTITYETIYGTRSYAVSYVGTISNTDWSYLQATADNRITLTTCLADQPA